MQPSKNDSQKPAVTRQGVVGVGSAEGGPQASNAAVRWLTKLSRVSLMEISIFPWPKSNALRIPGDFGSLRWLCLRSAAPNPFQQFNGTKKLECDWQSSFFRAPTRTRTWNPLIKSQKKLANAASLGHIGSTCGCTARRFRTVTVPKNKLHVSLLSCKRILITMRTARGVNAPS